MSQKRTLPETASVAIPMGEVKLHAPSADRNAAAIRDIVLHYAPSKGRALEIASGTGQHVVTLARALPDVIWQPSDIEPDRRASIDAWAVEADNILAACHLDATSPGWASDHAAQNLILAVNLLHLISAPEAEAVINGAAQALAPGGRLMVYGPFLRGGETTSEGDANFHASLRAQDAEIGYKDDFDVIDWMHASGLALVDVVEMPANNLCLIAARPA